ncbi:4402_t:CDS:2 [Paraglomus occultum]|uniref:4402_t:CDS:1 n=1 Tax=Paraglomus occultum TaxID=144539 RepID=A0A9N9FPJ1_9GLOM|nr:4402_t:CDS:2 [Paraglomus occultum]
MDNTSRKLLLDERKWNILLISNSLAALFLLLLRVNTRAHMSAYQTLFGICSKHADPGYGVRTLVPDSLMGHALSTSETLAKQTILKSAEFECSTQGSATPSSGKERAEGGKGYRE